jgi:hypothetical protein
MASKHFFKTVVTLPVARIITSITIRFIFHIRCISIHTLLYFIYFPVFFCVTFLSAGTAISTNMHVSPCLFLITIPGLFAITSPSTCTS